MVENVHTSKIGKIHRNWQILVRLFGYRVIQLKTYQSKIETLTLSQIFQNCQYFIYGKE